MLIKDERSLQATMTPLFLNKVFSSFTNFNSSKYVGFATIEIGKIIVGNTLLSK